MKRHESARPRARVVLVLLAVFLGWAAGAGAAEPGGSAKPEGIKVHGHWTIDVRNPDGTLVSHHEVENALHHEGAGLLAGLLANHHSDPMWMVLLRGFPDLDPCGLSASPCQIVEPRYPEPPGPLVFKNLSLNLPMDRAIPDGTLELSGSATAARDTNIREVSSDWQVGSTGGLYRFTRKVLAVPVPVRLGQVIQVKVVFSFS